MPKGPTPKPIAERFWPKVDVRSPDECWEWIGHRERSGYGMMSTGSVVDGSARPRYAHRVAWFIEYGQWPTPGRHLDHLCRNPPCVNVRHLEEVQPRENMRRGIGRPSERIAQTHCKYGHEYTPENTRITPANRRICRACHRKRERQRRLTHS